jgi:hypothetical protein
MLDFLNSLFEIGVYGFKGIVGLLTLTGGIAIVGSVIAFIYLVVANIIFWPIFLTRQSKVATKVQHDI